MAGALRSLTWWRRVYQELREPWGGWNRYVMLRARPSLFGCRRKIVLNGREIVCGSRLTELRGPVSCGSYNVQRIMVCETCGMIDCRPLGRVTNLEDE